MPRDLTNRVIAITGASAGIGRATALACARAGMDMALNARRADLLDEVAREIDALGRAALVVPGDVTRDDDVQRLIDAAVERFGRLDVAMANAGYGIESPGDQLDDETIRRIFDVNFMGTVRVVRSAVPVFRRQGHGHVVITSSSLARFTLPYYSAYTITKAAQTQYARSLRLELEPEGIDVSVVHPITTLTEFFQVSARNSGRGFDDIPHNVPRFFVQPAERVANAIVRCLRRPVPEVWTSHIVRTAAGLMVMFPRFHDFAMRGEARRRRERMARGRAEKSTPTGAPSEA